MKSMDGKIAIREKDVDLFRGIGIILMILNHVYFCEKMDIYIHSFHMPLWFIISGYFYNGKYSLKKVLVKRLKTIIVPYLIFSILYCALWQAFGYNQWGGIIWPNTMQIPFNGALWFLPALFFSSIIGFCLIKYFPVKISTLVGVFICLVGMLHICNLPLAIDSSLVGIGFYVLGYYFKTFGNRVLSLSFVQVIFLGIINVILVFANGLVNMRTNIYGNFFLFCINAVLGTILYWNISRLLLSVNFNLGKKLIDLICEIGNESILYVCVNQFFIFCFEYFFSDVCGIIIIKIVETIIILCLVFFMNRIIKKTWFKWILGY